MEKVRKRLRQMDGKRLRFRATFARYGKKSYGLHESDTLLLRDVVLADTGELVADHIWFTRTKCWQKLNLTEGDLVEFDARIKSYRAGYQGRREEAASNNPPRWDYKLAWPTDVRLVSPPNPFSPTRGGVSRRPPTKCKT